MDTRALSNSMETLEDLQALFSNADFRVSTNLPVPHEGFVGRKDLLKTIQHKISTASTKNIFVLYGTGGIGKTQVALKYAWTHQWQYTAVLWFNAISLESIRVSYLSIAKQLIVYYAELLPDSTPPYGLIAQYLGLKGLVDEDGQVTIREDAPDCIADAVKLWLNIPRNTGWLIIYDNYDDPDSFLLRDYIPTVVSGKIIVTSQLRECARLGQGIPIGLFTEQESIQLLLHSSQKFSDISSADGIFYFLCVKI